MGGKRARRHESKRGLVVPLVVVALLAAGGAALILEKRTTPAEAGQDAACPRVRVAVTEGIIEPMREAAAAISTGGRCIDLQVSPALGTWGRVPDADLWVPAGNHFASAVPTAEHLTESLASTPVLLAAPPAPQQLPGWTEALATGGVVTADPGTDEASAQVLLAVAAGTGVVGDQLQDAKLYDIQFRGLMMATAQGQVDDNASGDVNVVTEQAVLQAGGDAAKPSRVTAPAATPFLEHPLLRLTPVGSGEDTVGTAAQRLKAWFASPEGAEALARVGLRPADRAPLADSPVPVTYQATASPTSAAFTAVLKEWRRLHVQLNTLIVLDASGSMRSQINGVRRADIAAKGLSQALAQAASRSRMGLWSFSVDRGGPGQDWAEVAPPRQLGDRTGNRTQRERMAQELTEYGATLGGGTGLFDTALAAYKAAVKNYRPNHDNTLVLITDGSNEDAESVELKALVAELKRLRNDERPVRIVGVAVAADDSRTLSAIAEATGGKSYEVANDQEMRDFYVALMLDRF